MDHQRLRSRLRDLPSTTRWTIGTAVFREPESENPTILLLQRVGLETTFPNAWEIPGGQIEETDETVAHAVRREVLATTSLTVANILGEIEPMSWESKGSSNIQLNYIITVHPGSSVKPSPEKYSDCVWARLEELDYLHISPAMKTVIQDAFIFLADME
ncbi:NUDIX hydrolase domain-like protein [Penicillium capsulatum]|uniref:NUDIX hydrolase domain-like protein n=1 Tax=Penicillium capsulatum TaxID=69766 RepID=A0A9W9HZD7_9EURO|nr:NUDIX hydrolase domain-like protein [Penicillium capsulatum]KAJ6117079.1 NUDIX hydrolase domain-like protein [Penicillium capsulatum]